MLQCILLIYFQKYCEIQGKRRHYSNIAVQKTFVFQLRKFLLKLGGRVFSKHEVFKYIYLKILHNFVYTILLVKEPLKKGSQSW